MRNRPEKSPTDLKLIMIQRYGLVGYHTAILLLAVTIAYGVFLLWQPLNAAGRSTTMIVLTLACSAMAGLANASAAWSMIKEANSKSQEINVHYLALALGLLLVLAASALFAGF